MKAADTFAIEQLSPDFGFYLRTTELLAERRSPMQHIEIVQTPLFGRAMRIDGCFMTSEQDEFFYHEPMVHLPAITHGQPQQALIIGGGDGGAAVNVEWQVRRNLAVSSKFGGEGDASLSIRWRRESDRPGGDRTDRRRSRSR